MATRRNLLVPNRRRVVYAPVTVPSNPEDALEKLLAMELSEALGTVPHIVDPVLLPDLATGLRHVEFLSKEQGAKVIALRKAVDEIRAINTRRRAVIGIKGPAVVAREQGEAKQLAAEENIGLDRMKEREVQRRFHARRLWDLCCVRHQVECIPFPEFVDPALTQIIEMLPLRHAAGYFDVGMKLHRGEVTLPDGTKKQLRGFDDVGPGIERISKALATQTPRIFGVEGERALSFIHEIRFYGHGLAGDGEKDAVFQFAGEDVTTTDLINKRFSFSLADHMAPGASILLEGCETGRGSRGKEFMGALASLCFGPKKWGFVRASTQPIIMSLDKIEGPVPGDPETYLWPDDFS